MKKNKWMRLASVLLVLCLLTTSVISGTFAKYVSSDSAEDSARVAKWGVVASIEGSLFGPTYKGVGERDGNKITDYGVNRQTVSSADKANVVAPGTLGDTLQFAVQGIPEVSSEVAFGDALDANGEDANLANAEVTLTKNTYGVMVHYTGILTNESIVGKYKSKDSKIFTLVPDGEAYDNAYAYFELQDLCVNGDVYKPVKFAFNVAVPGGAAIGSTGNDLSTALAGIERQFDGKTFKPNEQLNLWGSLTWEWKFEEGTPTGIYAKFDKQDTILGDMIALTTAPDGASGMLNELNGGGPKTFLVYGEGGVEKFMTVHVAEVTIADGAANAVYVAYKGDTAPGSAYTAEITTASAGTLNENVLAVLGMAVNASLTCVQVD